jgi:hypothetical protein
MKTTSSYRKTKWKILQKSNPALHIAEQHSTVQMRPGIPQQVEVAPTHNKSTKSSLS